jgi:hypothetical protein
MRKATSFVVSENLGREWWEDPNATFGKRVREGGNDPWREIVGVVEDIYDNRLHRLAAHPRNRYPHGAWCAAARVVAEPSCQGLLLRTRRNATGLAAAAGVTRLMSFLLFGVTALALDPMTYAAVSALLFLAAMLASYLPARRAMSFRSRRSPLRGIAAIRLNLSQLYVSRRQCRPFIIDSHATPALILTQVTWIAT